MGDGNNYNQYVPPNKDVFFDKEDKDDNRNRVVVSTTQTTWQHNKGKPTESPEVHRVPPTRNVSFFAQPGILAAVIGGYSDRESDSFSLMFSCLIWSWYFSSLLLAFSSEISSCFWFSPMADNSSSIFTTLSSAILTRSSARLSSSSIIARERARLSDFISLSDAILLASLRFVSRVSISISLFMFLDSQ